MFNDLIMASKHWNKSSSSDRLFHLPCCVCACLWAVVQTWWGGCLPKVFAQSGASTRSCWAQGGRLYWAMCVFRLLIWGRGVDWSLCPDEDGPCALYTSGLQPVLASANWQLRFDFAHWSVLHPWKCVWVCFKYALQSVPGTQVRRTECSRQQMFGSPHFSKFSVAVVMSYLWGAGFRIGKRTCFSGNIIGGPMLSSDNRYNETASKDGQQL